MTTTAPAPSAQTAVDQRLFPERPKLARGVSLAGQMQESAFVNPPWLLERDGAGYVQVTDLLYRIAQHADGSSTVDEISQKITRDGKPVNPNTVRSLIAQLLIPRGLIEMADGDVVPVAQGGSSPLALNMRVKMISPETITPVTNILRVLFWPPAMVAILAIAALVEVWIYAIHGIGASLHDALYAPGLMLFVLLMIVVSAAFHELGHAAALHYAGGKIKGMGAGIYIVYPAFFTDVSDNYRLPRWQRVRTDLGGFYFNLIFALAIMTVYALTGQEFLLLMVLLINLEILHQLLPFLRLDGYWALADITGVPDFFSQMTAFVRAVLPRGSAQGRKLPELKRWAKVVFACYMLITIPLLVFLLVLMIRSVPRVLATAWDSFSQQGQAFMVAQASGNILGALGAIGQALLLLIPTAGLLYTLFSLGRRFTMGMWKFGNGSGGRRAISGIAYVAAVAVLGFMWLPELPSSGGGTVSAGPVSVGPFSPVAWQPIQADERGTVQDVVLPASTPAAAVRSKAQSTVGPTPEPTFGAPVTDAQTRGTSEATSVATPVAQLGQTPAATARSANVTPVRTAPAATATAVRATITRTPVRGTLTPTLIPR